MTDAELLRRYAQDRSGEAFTELVRRRIDFVYSAARRQAGGDAHLAEDITQEVFTDLARRAGQLCRHPALNGWLYTATRFAAAKSVRTQARRRRREQESFTMQETQANAPAHPDWDRLRPTLDEAMHQLKARDRQLILRRFFDGASLAEVGAELQITANAAQKGVDRALEKLRRRLARDGVTSSGGALALLLTQQTIVAAPAALTATVTGHALAAGALSGGIAGFVSPLLQFMKTTKLAASLIGVTLLLAAAGTAYDLRATRQAEVALAAGRQSLAATTERLQARALARYGPLLAQLQLSPDQVAQFAQIVAEAEGGFGFSRNGYRYSFSAADQSATPAETTARLQQLLGSAGFQSYQDYQRTAPAAGFADLVGQAAFSALKLSAAQSDLLADQIMQRDERSFDILSSVPEAVQGSSFGGNGPFSRNPFLLTSDSEDGQPLQPATAEGRAAAQLLQENDASFQQAALSLLGPDGYGQLLQYERTLPVREVADGLASSSAGGAAPLNADQADQLALVLANASNPYQHGGVARSGNLIDWDQALAQAASILAPPQIAALQAQAAPTQAMRRLRAAVREAGGFGEWGKVAHAVTGRDD